MNKPRAYIEFGPTGRDSVTIKDENGKVIDLPVTSIKVSLPSHDGVSKATITMERVHVTASVAQIDITVDSVWCRSWRWILRMAGRRSRQL